MIEKPGNAVRPKRNQEQDHVVIEMPKHLVPEPKVKHPGWAKLAMAALLMVAGVCLGVACYATFSKPNVVEKIVEKRIEVPATKSTKEDSVEELKEAVEKTDGSWLSKIKAVGSWINDNKVALGVGLACGAAAYSTKDMWSNKHGSVHSGGKCGGDDRRPSLNPKKWGPPAWDFLHSVAIDFPDDPNPAEKKAAKEFVKSLQTMLPCNQCRGHFKDNMKKLSPNDDYYTSRKKLGQFFIDVRKDVALNYGDGKIKGMDATKWDLDMVNKHHGKESAGCGAGAKPWYQFW